VQPNSPSRTEPKKKDTLVSVLIIAVISLVVIRAYDSARDEAKHPAVNLASGKALASDSSGPKSAPVLSAHDSAMYSTSISKWDWRKAGFDNIMQANFTIQNGGMFDVKDIKITCVHSAPSGTVIDENTRTIYEIVKAHSKRTFRNFDMGFINTQVASSSCKIDDLAVSQ